VIVLAKQNDKPFCMTGSEYRIYEVCSVLRYRPIAVFIIIDQLGARYDDLGTIPLVYPIPIERVLN
jgi:hypothetical protein